MPFWIVRNDIVNMKVDAVVNSANPRARIGAGVDSAIYQKAGWLRLLAARKRIGALRTGEAAATPAYALPAKHIIHTVGPVWKDGKAGEEKALYSCYRESLRTAAGLGCESIAFPMISTGAYGFPKDLALKTAVSAISEFLLEHEMTVYLVVFDRKSFELSGKLFEKVDAYIDETYVSLAKMEQYQAVEQTRIMDEDAVEGGVLEGQIHSGRREGRTPEPEELVSRTKAAKSSTEESGVLWAPSVGKGGIQSGRSLEDLISQVGETFSQSLFRLIDEKGKTDVEVYKRANIDRKLFHKIRSNEHYHPSKKTVLALAIALELNLDETKDFLARAGLAFSPGSVSDLIVQYFIMNKVYDIYQINLSLFDHDQQVLG